MALGKESACNAGDLGLIPGSGRSPGGGHGNLLQCSCLENPHGQRSLAGCSPWGRAGLDTTMRQSQARTLPWLSTLTSCVFFKSTQAICCLCHLGCDCLLHQSGNTLKPRPRQTRLWYHSSWVLVCRKLAEWVKWTHSDFTDFRRSGGGATSK